MNLHPDLEAFLDLVDQGRAAGRPPLHALTIDAARETFREASRGLDPAAPVLAHEPLSLPTRDGATLPARLYLPRALRPAPAILYFHGGGYCVGDLETHDALCRRLAVAVDGAVLAVGYRRAPEHPFPGPVDDALDAWDWLVAKATDLGLDPQRLVVAGDSAGAALASLVASTTARRGGPAPRAQVLCYPTADALGDYESRVLFADGYLLESATLDWFYDLYLPDRERRSDPRCSPLRGSVPDGLAPALVLLAQFDPLLDEGRAYVDHLLAAGTPVDWAVCPGLTHDFLRLASLVPDVAEHYARIGTFLAARAGF
ncbi:alpha/beta hydrolase [Pseudomonas rhizoryzae]|uniref:alpha/beta hydrolase n=1 Tax=Pseudomonas rhizoryzae TaxID=2571129 RepID=UPI000736035B|nr:alpha/beta hydrolase [Pseudomonas rhizoryzae]KTT12967.1 hypothetical protein NS2R_06920 [Pseudomonas psychrotolerans]KTT31601.1 hypothetical protein NS201_09810 [Pseudomonas psychrotolerans]KTT37504.1 hypothetical protein SB9_01835 [Pseudomonas psychrotolerans]KTT71682.1 hypothetical protein SB18R_21520 [Pseudomonas psychrotolerans]